MKKLFLSLAAVVAISATASAQQPTFYPVPAPQPAPAIVSSGGGSCGAAPIPPAGPYAPYYGGGVGPAKMTLLQRLFKKNLPVNNLPAAQGGQLAFPINPFVRSPRDFFMVD